MKSRAVFITTAFGFGVFNLSAATLYVSLESPNPTPPFTNWLTAARVIQDAVDAAKAGDTVLVTNGLYAAGQREIFRPSTDWLEWSASGLTRVVVRNSTKLESVNGPSVTIIKGDRLLNEAKFPTNGVRCVFLGGNAVLSGFTLTNGFARCGGGAYGEAGAMLTNCVLTGNLALFGAGAFSGILYGCTLTGNSAVGDFSWGGGVSDCTLFNCTLTENSTSGDGGGGARSTLYNCVLAHNQAYDGGGAAYSSLYNCTVTSNSARGWGGGVSANVILNNCIVFFNSAPRGENWCDDCGHPVTFNNSCTAPLPTNGVRNIAEPPLFADIAAGDFRLQAGSPCIDAGMNLLGNSMLSGDWKKSDWEWTVAGSISDPTDILGNTRFIDGNSDGKVAWDIGAYEFNSFKPPRFIGPASRTAEGWTLNIMGEPKKSVQVQKSTNLTAWVDLWSGLLPAEGGQEVIDSDTSQKVKFYRAVVP